MEEGVQSEEDFAALSYEEQIAWWEAYWLARPRWEDEPLPHLSKTYGGCIITPLPDSNPNNDEESDMALTAEQQEEIEKRKQSVLDTTLANPTWSQNKIGEYLGIEQTSVSRYQRALRAEGKLGPPRSGPGAQGKTRVRNALVELPKEQVKEARQEAKAAIKRQRKKAEDDGYVSPHDRDYTPKKKKLDGRSVTARKQKVDRGVFEDMPKRGDKAFIPAVERLKERLDIEAEADSIRIALSILGEA